MGIESNATSSEKKSPFYLKNENTCKNLENFIDSYNGKISGKYNASSYFVKAKINLPKEWIIEIKKSNFRLKIKSFLNRKINIYLQQSDLVGYNISNNKVAAEILEMIQPIITADKISNVSLKDNLLVIKINSDELYLNELKNLIELTRNE